MKGAAVLLFALSLSLSLVLAGAGGSGPQPDRPQPDRPQKDNEWGYRPADGATVSLNPPALSWVAAEGAARYTVQWADNAAFTDATTVRNLPWTVYTHNETLSLGEWWWRYRITSIASNASNESGTDYESPWSRARKFIVPAAAVVFPQPTMAELARRIPTGHPRLFVRSADLPGLRKWAAGGGKDAFRKLLDRADQLVDAEPTPEPTVRATPSDPKTRKYWWTNRVQTITALQEAEVLSFAWLMTRDAKYGAPARRFTLRLAEWDPDGPSSFQLNCEVAKPLIHRLARAYDWAWPLFSEAERKKIRAALLRRATDAWNSWEVKQGAGHLNQPYSSHGNRTWHKLAENAIATFGETPESTEFLHYAVTKFYGAYPVWSDDDGGWHEGLAYLSSYMSKVPWWIDVAESALAIDTFKTPFFSRIGDYAMYSAPPGTPDLGFGDRSVGPVSRSWSFLHYYARRTQNPHWTWWLREWNIDERQREPVLAFLRSRARHVTAAPPTELPVSKVFRGIGVAVMNTNLLDGRRNVQVRFKSSRMGRRSHGQDPHNAFTLNAYGKALLVNNVYRDLYGSPFHKRWVRGTRSQNAVLVDGHGQSSGSPSPDGVILKAEFRDGLDYVAGEAAPAYEGRLRRARRHIIFLKPDIILIADELEAPAPSSFQWMLHAQQEFSVDESSRQLRLDRDGVGVVVDYVAAQPLRLRQWTGYDPAPDLEYLRSVNSRPPPPQWHVEAATPENSAEAFTVTVLRVFKGGQSAKPPLRSERTPSKLLITDGDFEATFEPALKPTRATIRRARREWTITLPD